jgi:hypothetical protein
MLIMFVCLKGTENILSLNGTVCKDPDSVREREIDQSITLMEPGSWIAKT